MTQASTFELGCLGDGATVWCMNMMVVCGDANPVVVSICDCTDHMSEGRKKDATYIAEMFQEKVNGIDPDSRNLDDLFFNGASNMQNTGQILCQIFSWA